MVWQILNSTHLLFDILSSDPTCERVLFVQHLQQDLLPI
jgi:hypothetical protein